MFEANLHFDKRSVLTEPSAEWHKMYGSAWAFWHGRFSNLWKTVKEIRLQVFHVEKQKQKVSAEDDTWYFSDLFWTTALLERETEWSEAQILSNSEGRGKEI